MGASSGIGRAIAETFASRGVKIGVGARRVADLEMLKAKYPGMIECEAIDVTVPEAKTGLARLIEKMGGMDIYIHVSGIGGANPNLVVEQETKVTDTNVTGFARMISAAYNYFRHNIGSRYTRHRRHGCLFGIQMLLLGISGSAIATGTQTWHKGLIHRYTARMDTYSPTT